MEENWGWICWLGGSGALITAPSLCFDQVVREALLEDRKVMTKSSSVDLVTQTDQKVEQLIIQSVKEKFPTHR